MKTLIIECPDQFHDQLDHFVKEGWDKPSQAIIEALRRFLKIHRPN